jgi:hypothetical protein
MGQFSSPSCSDLLSLIEAGHGIILPHNQLPPPPTTQELLQQARQPQTLIIVDPKRCSTEQARNYYFNAGRHAISASWLLDSISHYKPLDIREYYILPEDRSTNVLGGLTEPSQDF